MAKRGFIKAKEERMAQMITFIPPYLGEEIKSNAEKKMYDILQKLDMKNAYILHSLGLPKHQTKIYGEIDFVVVCDRGVACLEIKGGRVECEEGKWIFIDRYGAKNFKAEGPFAQVAGNMFSLRDVLKKKFANNPHIKNILMACGVVFPDIHFSSSSQEIIPEIIYDAKTENITSYMEGIFDYWEGRQHREPSKLSPSDIQKVVSFLRGEFTFIPSLGSRLDSVEKHLLRMTSEQVQIMDALEANDHLLISGGAGTGKTLLAANFAEKQAAQGKKVLFLTYNKNLANNVSYQIGESAYLKIINIHALFGEYVTVDLGSLEKNAQKYFSEELPDAFYASMKAMDNKRLGELQYDFLVMDEGQDILKPNYLYCLDFLLKGGFDKGRWAVFYDEKQNIYNPEYQDGLDILLSYPGTKFRLFVNCRNTIQIGTYSTRISGVDTGTFLKENGEEVQKIMYSDEQDFGSKVKDILKKLKKEQILMRDIVFLSPKRYENSMLGKTDIPVNVLGWDSQNTADLPVYATIQGFKGLDSKVVVLFGIEDIRSDVFSRYVYIAMTRARALLYIIGSEDFWNNLNEQK